MAVKVVQQFQHVAPLRSGKRSEAPVIQDQQICLGVSGRNQGPLPSCRISDCPGHGDCGNRCPLGKRYDAVGPL